MPGSPRSRAVWQMRVHWLCHPGWACISISVKPASPGRALQPFRARIAVPPAGSGPARSPPLLRRRRRPAPARGSAATGQPSNRHTSIPPRQSARNAERIHAHAVGPGRPPGQLLSAHTCRIPRASSVTTQPSHGEGPCSGRLCPAVRGASGRPGAHPDPERQQILRACRSAMWRSVTDAVRENAHTHLSADQRGSGPTRGPAGAAAILRDSECGSAGDEDTGHSNHRRTVWRLRRHQPRLEHVFNR